MHPFGDVSKGFAFASPTLCDLPADRYKQVSWDARGAPPGGTGPIATNDQNPNQMSNAGAQP
jgi:hypothetical protein